MKGWLVYPPFAGFEQPPLGTSLLVAYARSQGEAVAQLDLNIEMFDFMLSKSSISRMRENFAALSRRPGISSEEYARYLYLSLLSEAVAQTIDATKHDVRDPKTLGSAYWETKHALGVACMLLSQWASLGRECRDRTALGEIASLVKCTNGDPVCDFVRKRVEDVIVPSNPSIVGISIVYPSQLPYGLYLAKIVKEITTARVVMGGPSISGIASDGLVPKGFADLVDYVVVGDGFSPLVDFLRDRVPEEALSRDHFGSGRRARPVASSNPNDLPPPDFTDLPLEKYLTPELILPLYPSRGCYWGRCTFCTVHELNPVFMERDPDRVAQDMIYLNKRFGAHHFYMSCDVLSPKSMLSLSKTLSEKAPGLKWQTEARFEKALSADSIRRLADGGCELLKFGLESGSESVLRDMRKGTDLETARAILRACKKNNIQTAVYCIVGFPTESEKDLRKTIEFLKDMRSAIDYVGFHRFVLNSSSEVSLRPADFGIEPVGTVNEVTSEMGYRATRGMAQSYLSDVFERVKDEIGEVICTEIPVGPMPFATCVHQPEGSEKKGAFAEHLVTRPIRELGVSIGDMIRVDGLTGDITVERKQ